MKKAPKSNLKSAGRKSKNRFKNLLREALTKGLISNEVLAYIKGLGYARYHNPGDEQIKEAIQEVLGVIQEIYESSTELPSEKELQEYRRLAEEKLGEGLLEDFSHGQSEQLSISLPNKVISYLEKQRVLFIPVDINTSTIAEVGKMRRFRSKGESYKMYGLNKHWVGLYFRSNPESIKRRDARFLSMAEPIVMDSTVFSFTDANLRNTNIDLFYPSFTRKMNPQDKKNCNILYLNIAFKRCWVKGMDLQFWRYAANFPGTITVTFEDCPDFTEASMPYLSKETGGIRYYFDLDKFAHERSADTEFTRYIEVMYSFSENFIFEHLR